LTGRSSTPRLLDSFSGFSGIPDRPPSRAMTSEYGALAQPSLRAKRSNPSSKKRERMDCVVASLLAMTLLLCQTQLRDLAAFR
jgi:hypothetical protein